MPSVTVVRREQPQDVATAQLIQQEAFRKPGQPADDPGKESRLLERLRADQGWLPELSLVVERDGELLGHVTSTAATLGGVTGLAVGLGPIAVRPDAQHAGVGSLLVHASVATADALGYAVVVLLGSRTYYPRFGFEPAERLGIAAPEPAWADNFMARTLSAWSPEAAGPFRYAAPFDEL